ncbi:TM2 domain-containing protein [Planococcus soli]|uniref:TM2 domain-containing protein n=1 Tax=Planococcus soli TaxID=2666072 RepID=UPI00115F477D|nr:TM2 domain-containing protein [Planococcus soli]
MKRKSKLASALLAIFLGDFGAHKFYLGRPGMGVLYLLFFWTGIPAVIGIIEGILYLLQSEETFQEKHGRR